MLSTSDKTHTNISRNIESENNTLPIYRSEVYEKETEDNIQKIKENIQKKEQFVSKDLSNITEKDYKEIELENKNVTELDKINSNNLILVYNENENKFTFYNSNKSILGSFNFKQLIKYIGRQVENNFYSNIESGYSEEMIKSFLGEILVDPITGKIHFNLKSHIDSPFMGNIDLLIKLNNLFYHYEKNELNNDLNIIQNEKVQYTLKQSIKQFIYLMINHTLKIIAIATEDNVEQSMKEKLLKYSVALTYRINSFMKEHLENYNKQYKSLYNNLDKITKMKKVLNSKIDLLETKINKQNEIIFSAINGKKIEQPKSEIITEKDFEKFFSDESEKDQNNFYSEFVPEESEKNKSNESYLITETGNLTNSDVSMII